MPATTTLFPRPTAAKPALQELGEERRESARIRDVLLAMAGDEPVQAYLVEPDEASFTQGDRPECSSRTGSTPRHRTATAGSSSRRPFWPIEEDRLDYLSAMRDVDPIEHLPALTETRILLQFARSDFFIAAMTGLELRKAAGESTELKAYDGEHDMAMDEVRADRLRFLEETLRFGGTTALSATAPAR